MVSRKCGESSPPVKLLGVLGCLAFALGAGRGEDDGEAGQEDDSDERSAIHFELPEVSAHPGSLVEVPVTVRTEAGLSLAAFSVEYAPGVLGLDPPVLSSEIAAILSSNPDADSHFIWFGDDVLGWLQVSLIMDYQARETIVIPPGAVHVASLWFAVSQDAPPGKYPLAFTRPETAQYDGEFEDENDDSVYNWARKDGVEFEGGNEYDDGNQPELVDGAIVISIIGDVSVFARGDANIDHELNISDPVRILERLFLGTPALACEDAADANDDGRINITDAVSILSYLFAADPNTITLTMDLVRDPTADELGCDVY